MAGDLPKLWEYQTKPWWLPREALGRKEKEVEGLEKTKARSFVKDGLLERYSFSSSMYITYSVKDLKILSVFVVDIHLFLDFISCTSTSNILLASYKYHNE